MKAVSTIFVVQFLAAIVAAVFLEDAFVNDWTRHRHGNITQFSLLSGKSILGLSDQAQLVRLHTENFGVSTNFLIDLKKLNVDKYSVVGPLIFTYSDGNPTVYLWDIETGVLEDYFTLEAPPVAFEPFFNEGIVVLDKSGELLLLKVGKKTRIGNFPADSFAVSVYGGIATIFISSKLISVSRDGSARDVGSVMVPVSHFVEFKDNVLLTTTEAYFIGAEISKVYVNFAAPKIVDLAHIADISKDEVTIYSLLESGTTKLYTEKVPNAIDIEIIDFSLNTFLVTKTVNATQITDLTDFLLSGDVASLAKYELPCKGELLDVLVHRFNDSIAFSLLNKIGQPLLLETMITSGESFSEPIFPGEMSILKSILVDIPLSPETIDKVHHLVEESHSSSVLYRWLSRTMGHLTQLGQYSYYLVSGASYDTSSVEHDDKYGFQKSLFLFDEKAGLIASANSRTGNLPSVIKTNLEGRLVDMVTLNSELFLVSEHTVVAVDIRTGNMKSVTESEDKIEKVLKLPIKLSEDEEEEGKEPNTVAFKVGSTLQFVDPDVDVVDSQYFIEEQENALQAFKIEQKKLVPTWRFSRKGEKIQALLKNTEDLTSAIGISRADRSVLYKYLNPNLVSVLTKDTTGSLKLYLVDGVTGNILHIQKNEGDVIDELSINLIQSDNWVIYSYFVKYPKIEQRIVVVDLFGTSETAVGGKESVFGFNSTISQISSKSFIFPEKIVSLSSTRTKFGITVKSIIALTSSGSLIEIPKFLLNSRRIDNKKMTQDDFGEDFKMTPYEPVVPKNNYQVLNHKNKLRLTEANQQILVLPTELESTAIVCFVNDLSQFCTIVQPSLSYDLLSGNFDKVNLAITLVVLLVGVLASKPFVYSKKLNAKWVD